MTPTRAMMPFPMTDLARQILAPEVARLALELGAVAAKHAYPPLKAKADRHTYYQVHRADPAFLIRQYRLDTLRQRRRRLLAAARKVLNPALPPIRSAAPDPPLTIIPPRAPG